MTSFEIKRFEGLRKLLNKSKPKKQGKDTNWTFFDVFLSFKNENKEFKAKENGKTQQRNE